MVDLAIIFDGILRSFADTDYFSGPTCPSFFVVYAHDAPAVGKADAKVVRQLLDWLKILRTKSLSDRSPSVLWYTREDSNVSSDILSNQLCLLPRSGQVRYDYNISSVDKVILCCSEVLQKYYEDPRMKKYTQALKNTYPETKVSDIGKIKGEIQEIVNAYEKEDGFHHVLTELAFLEIRHRLEGKGHGIIPILLNGDGIKYLPFFQNGVPLWLNRQQNSTSIIHESQGLHRLFFNLLRQIYDGLDADIMLFEDCYRECVRELTESKTSSNQEIQDMVSRRVRSALQKLNQHMLAVNRGG